MNYSSLVEVKTGKPSETRFQLENHKTTYLGIITAILDTVNFLMLTSFWQPQKINK